MTCCLCSDDATSTSGVGLTHWLCGHCFDGAKRQTQRQRNNQWKAGFTASPALSGCGSVEQGCRSGTILFNLNIKIPVILLNDFKKHGKGLLIGTKKKCIGSLACTDSVAAD